MASHQKLLLEARSGWCGLVWRFSTWQSNNPHWKPDLEVFWKRRACLIGLILDVVIRPVLSGLLLLLDGAVDLLLHGQLVGVHAEGPVLRPGKLLIKRAQIVCKIFKLHLSAYCWGLHTSRSVLMRLTHNIGNVLHPFSGQARTHSRSVMEGLRGDLRP